MVAWREASLILARWKTARNPKTHKIFVTVGALLSCRHGRSVSRPAGSRNDARLVEPGKLLRRYIRPKGECTAEWYVHTYTYMFTDTWHVHMTYICIEYVYVALCSKADGDIRCLYTGCPRTAVQLKMSFEYALKAAFFQCYRSLSYHFSIVCG